MLPAPTTAVAYRKLIEDAAFEMQDLERCAEDDMDDELSDLIPAFKAIGQALSDIVDGKAAAVPSGNDLPFMSLAQTYRHVIPVYSMLDSINRAHRGGMTVQG